MASLVLCHLMDGIMQSVQVVALAASSQVELALGCAELAVYTPSQVVLTYVLVGFVNKYISALGYIYFLTPGINLSKETPTVPIKTIERIHKAQAITEGIKPSNQL